MKWSQPADRRVVEAVVASFREPVEGLHELLSALSLRQWEQSYYWLDASGVALYFFSRVQDLALADTIPSATWARMKQNLADNKIRSASMFREYVDLNQAFQQQGIDYCNLKGFTLYPESCPDSTLRYQSDFDFLVDGEHLEACHSILSKRGYVVRGSTSTVREYKTDGHQLADIADLYKTKQQRCVEIHFKCEERESCAPTRDARLDRLERQGRDGVSLPALSAVDQLVAQAVHLFGHICSPHTRLAWLLEHRWNIETHAADSDFWNRVSDQIRSDDSSALAVGVSALLVADLFNASLPARIEEIAATRVPEGVALWLRRYGRRAVLADFPGTKLNLMLREQICQNRIGWHDEKRKTLVPSRRPLRIVHFDDEAGAMDRLRGELYQLRYEFFRLRFHVVEGFRYAGESVRWGRYLKRHKARVEQKDTGHAHAAAN